MGRSPIHREAAGPPNRLRLGAAPPTRTAACSCLRRARRLSASSLVTRRSLKAPSFRAGAQRPRRHLDLPPGHRQRRDLRGRPRPARAGRRREPTAGPGPRQQSGQSRRRCRFCLHCDSDDARARSHMGALVRRPRAPAPMCVRDRRMARLARCRWWWSGDDFATRVGSRAHEHRHVLQQASILRARPEARRS